MYTVAFLILQWCSKAFASLVLHQERSDLSRAQHDNMIMHVFASLFTDLPRDDIFSSSLLQGLSESCRTDLHFVKRNNETLLHLLGWLH